MTKMTLQLVQQKHKKNPQRLLSTPVFTQTRKYRGNGYIPRNAQSPKIKSGRN